MRSIRTSYESTWPPKLEGTGLLEALNFPVVNFRRYVGSQVGC